MKDWIKHRDEISKRNREINNKLSPSKYEIITIKELAESILTNASYIEFASSLAHEEIIGFREAQEIIDWQKKRMNRSIECLQKCLGINEDKENE